MATRTDSIVRVESGKYVLDLELSVPAASKPTAVVVIVPGSGGLSDPYFDAEILRPAYSYADRGGITDALVNAGYVVAAYSVRGYRGASCLPANIEPARRAQYFVENCVDQEVRSGVALREITDDTRSVFRYLRHSRQFSETPQVALAFSEGMYHVAAAYDHEMGRNLAGIVSAGGPHDPMHQMAEYQLTRTAYFKMIDAAFAGNEIRKASAVDVAKANGKDGDFNLQGLVETMGSSEIGRSEVAARKAFWRETYGQVYQTFARAGIEGSMGATLDGAIINKAWSVNYYSQILADDSKPSEMLAPFKGSIGYLYGSDDVLVRIPSRSEFAESEAAAAGPRTLEIIDHADHGLSAKGMPTPQALKAILKGVAAVMAYHEQAGGR